MANKRKSLKVTLLPPQMRSGAAAWGVYKRAGNSPGAGVVDTVFDMQRPAGYRLLEAFKMRNPDGNLET